jgi:hypothetical protein
MGLTNNTKSGMLTYAKAQLNNAYIYQETGAGGVASVGQTLGLNAGAKIIDGAKPLSWGGSTPTQVATTNSAISNPINYSIPQNKAPNRVLISDNNATAGLRVINAIFELPTPLPSYTDGDGAYYVRDITITLTEV